MGEATTATPLVVVGAGAAGLTAVEALRRAGEHGPIVLIGAEPHLPYDRPPLSKGFLLGSVARERLLLREPEVLDRLQVDLRLGRTARGLDAAASEVYLDDGSVVPYHRLVIATGVRPVLPEHLAGSGNVFVLRTLDDADRLAAALRSASSMAVIGGGLLGYELAALGRTSGVQVTLLDRRQLPLEPLLGATAGQLVADLHRHHGVDLRLGARVTEVAAAGRSTSARMTLDDGSTLDADLVVAAVGSRPNVEWLAGSGLDLTDGIGCDQVGRAAPNIYAVGDVARWGASTTTGARIEHRTNASEQALTVAGQLTARREVSAGAPYFWTDQYGERIQVAGSIPPGSSSTLVAGELATRRFVLTATHEGTVCGVLGWRMPKDFARARLELLDG